MSTYAKYLEEKNCCRLNSNGIAGPKGPQGIPGEVGPAGFKGLTGPTGLTGTKGVGVRGETGSSGPMNTANKLQKIALSYNTPTVDYTSSPDYQDIITIPVSTSITLPVGKYSVQWSLAFSSTTPPDTFLYVTFESTITPANIYTTNVYNDVNPCAMIIEGNNLTACGNEILNITADDSVECVVYLKASANMTSIQPRFNISINTNPMNVL